MKSNAGISEEISRITTYLVSEPAPSCPSAACYNHGIPVSAGVRHYYAYGKADSGSKRYKCRECGKTFSVAQRSTLRQRLPQKNLQVFKLLMNKVPFARICEVTGISMQTLYDKLDFIHRQALAFAAKHERKLPELTAVQKHYIAVDRQEYSVNWSQRKDKRNVVLRAIGSADLASGYVFGMHLNFDPGLDAVAVEADAAACGDFAAQLPFRQYARLWLTPDYSKAISNTAKRMAKKPGRPPLTLGDEIADAYTDSEAREDVESPELLTTEERFPTNGMQVKTEYTMYAHFYYLRQLFQHADKVRFFLDQESGIRAAVLAAFEQEIRTRHCDAFYVRLGKELSVDEKRKVVAASRAAFKAVHDANPALTPAEVQVLMMKTEMARAAEIGKWSDRWLMHPAPNNAEPKKAICYLTDYGDYGEDHLARLYLKASLHPIDRFFMLIRRRLSLLERPIGSASKVGRTWYGYSAYQPENITKVLEVFRVFYNYCLAGKDGKTPAVRLGLVDRNIGMDQILSN
jgi:transposase-like protein